MVEVDLVALVGCEAETRTTMKMELKMIDDTHGVKANSACFYTSYAMAHGLSVVVVLGCSGVSKLERHRYTLSDTGPSV
jgi:hypothetical protein